MADKYSGTVTICKGSGLFLRSDEAGLIVRNFHGRTRRIAWTEISHFVDGLYTKEGVTSWQLFIVLRTGKRVRVISSVLAPADEVVAAVRGAAQAHGVPADLSGVAAKRDGRPALRGLYEDPGGQPGLRYWDRRQWSPLLPADFGESTSRVVRKAPPSWSALPTADGEWTGAAARARFFAMHSAVAVAIGAALLVIASLNQLSLPHHWRQEGAGAGECLCMGFFVALWALMARKSWNERKFFLKLDAVAKTAPGRWSLIPSATAAAVPVTCF